MKKRVLSLIMVGMTWAGVTLVKAADLPAISARTIGDVQPELMGRVVDWVSGQIAPTTNAGPMVTKAKTLDAIALSRALSSTNVAVPRNVSLILVAGLAGEVRYAVAMKGVVVLNIAAMRPSDLSTDAAREIFARRVEKEAVGGVATALGMTACPLIHCALFSAQTVEDLDEKARGLCPPCLGKFQDLMEK